MHYSNGDLVRKAEGIAGAGSGIAALATFPDSVHAMTMQSSYLIVRYAYTCAYECCWRGSNDIDVTITKIGFVANAYTKLAQCRSENVSNIIHGKLNLSSNVLGLQEQSRKSLNARAESHGTH